MRYCAGQRVVPHCWKFSVSLCAHPTAPFQRVLRRKRQLAMQTVAYIWNDEPPTVWNIFKKPNSLLSFRSRPNSSQLQTHGFPPTAIAAENINGLLNLLLISRYFCMIQKYFLVLTFNTCKQQSIVNETFSVHQSYRQFSHVIQIGFNYRCKIFIYRPRYNLPIIFKLEFSNMPMTLQKLNRNKQCSYFIEKID